MAKKEIKEESTENISKVVSPENINFQDYPYTYMVNLGTNEIQLQKSGRELPIEVNDYFNTFSGDENGVVKPPWVPNELEWLVKNNHILNRCINLRATLIAGFGYDFENKDHKNFEKLEEFMKYPNDTFGDTASDIFENILIQEGIYGYGPWLINKAFDKIQMFAATNTKSTFILPKTRNGRRISGVRKYVQISTNSGANPVEFYPYEKKPIDGRNYMHWIGNKKILSSYYPEPVYISAIGKIYEDIYVDQRNIDFFKNRAMGDYAILLSGAKMTKTNKEDSLAQIKKDFSGASGLGNQHKTIFLANPNEHSKLQIVDLSKNEDGQFITRQFELQRSIARMFGIMPALILLTQGGSGMGGGSLSVGDLFVENQIMIRPEQKKFENQVNLVLETLFGFDPEIKFRSIDTNNQKDMSVIASQIVSSGAKISNKELRKFIHKHGLMELDDPEIIPEEKDCVKPAKISTNIDGDDRPGTDTDDEADAPTTIGEDKFNDEK